MVRTNRRSTTPGCVMMIRRDRLIDNERYFCAPVYAIARWFMSSSAQHQQKELQVRGRWRVFAHNSPCIQASRTRRHCPSLPLSCARSSRPVKSTFSADRSFSSRRGRRRWLRHKRPWRRLVLALSSNEPERRAAARRQTSTRRPRAGAGPCGASGTPRESCSCAREPSLRCFACCRLAAVRWRASVRRCPSGRVATRCWMR